VVTLHEGDINKHRTPRTQDAVQFLKRSPRTFDVLQYSLQDGTVEGFTSQRESLRNANYIDPIHRFDIQVEYVRTVAFGT
jgi:spermidine synthase